MLQRRVTYGIPVGIRIGGRTIHRQGCRRSLSIGSLFRFETIGIIIAVHGEVIERSGIQCISGNIFPSLTGIKALIRIILGDHIVCAIYALTIRISFLTRDTGICVHIKRNGKSIPFGIIHGALRVHVDVNVCVRINDILSFFNLSALRGTIGSTDRGFNRQVSYFQITVHFNLSSVQDVQITIILCIFRSSIDGKLSVFYHSYRAGSFDGKAIYHTVSINSKMTCNNYILVSRWYKISFPSAFNIPCSTTGEDISFSNVPCFRNRSSSSIQTGSDRSGCNRDRSRSIECNG